MPESPPLWQKCHWIGGLCISSWWSHHCKHILLWKMQQRCAFSGPLKPTEVDHFFVLFLGRLEMWPGFGDMLFSQVKVLIMITINSSYSTFITAWDSLFKCRHSALDINHVHTNDLLSSASESCPPLFTQLKCHHSKSDKVILAPKKFQDPGLQAHQVLYCIFRFQPLQSNLENSHTNFMRNSIHPWILLPIYVAISVDIGLSHSVIDAFACQKIPYLELCDMNNNLPQWDNCQFSYNTRIAHHLGFHFVDDFLYLHSQLFCFVQKISFHWTTGAHNTAVFVQQRHKVCFNFTFLSNKKRWRPNEAATHCARHKDRVYQCWSRYARTFTMHIVQFSDGHGKGGKLQLAYYFESK